MNLNQFKINKIQLFFIALVTNSVVGVACDSEYVNQGPLKPIIVRPACPKNPDYNPPITCCSACVNGCNKDYVCN